MIEDIVGRLSPLGWDALSPAAKAKLRLTLTANLSVAVAGAGNVRLPRPAAAKSGPGLHGGGATPAGRDACFYNAAAMHARTQDDFHPVGNLHLGTVVIPPLLADAHGRDVDGGRFLDSLIVGYAAAVGLSKAFSPITTPKGLRSTGLYAPLGATAALARQRGLDAGQTASAIALTASLAAGLTQCWVDGSDEWQLHVAAAAANAWLATDLAAAGVRGGAHALDGPAGFYHAHAGVDATYAAIAADFDPDAAILETVLKRYPVSGICQPIVRLSERMVAEFATPPERIRSIRLEMRGFEMRYPGTLNKGPFRSFSDVLMSAAFCSATVVACRGFDFSDLFRHDHAERDRLIAATEVVEGADLPVLSCRIAWKLADGREIRSELIDGGAQLAIDPGTIDSWAEALWREGGRSAADYARFRDVVATLETRSVRELEAVLFDLR